MTHQNIAIPDDLMGFVTSRVDSGRYASTSEVVEQALRTLQREEQDNEDKLHALRAEVEEGVTSGIAEGDVFARVRERAGLAPRPVR